MAKRLTLMAIVAHTMAMASHTMAMAAHTMAMMAKAMSMVTCTMAMAFSPCFMEHAYHRNIKGVISDICYIHYCTCSET